VSADPLGNAERMGAASDAVSKLDSILPMGGPPPLDPATAARHALPDEEKTDTSLLDPPLIGGTITVGLGPAASARPPTTEPNAADVVTEIAAPSTGGAARATDLRVLLVLGGVALLPLLLLARASVARISRDPDARSASE
jgi:hypothetical protein